MALMKTIGAIETDNNINLDDESHVLWTNSSPASEISLVNITLSENVDDYILIAVKYAYNTTHLSDSNLYKSYFTPQQILDSDASSGTTMRPGMAISVETSADNIIVRWLKGYASNKKQMRIGSCTQYASTTTYNNYCIPTHIYGIK